MYCTVELAFTHSISTAQMTRIVWHDVTTGFAPVL